VLEPGTTTPAIDPDAPDLELVRRVLRSFPSFETINAAALDAGASGLAALMAERHRLGNGLLQWIISSNRAHIVSVPMELRLTGLGTRHQFVMLCAPPERQKRFDELRKEYGSRFLWHGSRPENWHAILRSGLRNMSGTTMQLNGAAYGSGIYLATDAATSLSYSGMGAAHRGSAANEPSLMLAAAESASNAFLAGNDLKLLALCEVADTDGIRKHGHIWVAPDENCVVTRFLFAFPNGLSAGGTTALDSARPEFVEQVRACIAALSISPGSGG